MAKSKQHETLLSTAADTAWLDPVREFCADHDLTLQVRGDNHIQIREDGAVILEWWPSTGTTMCDCRRGPACATPQTLVELLKRR